MAKKPNAEHHRPASNQLDKIEHLVVLMLENRSFDQMLGFLYADNGNRSPLGHGFEGLTGQEDNPDETGRKIKVFKIKADDDHCYLMPGADPGEGFQNTNMQLFSTHDPAPGEKPGNKGFVMNFKAAIASDISRGYKDTLPSAKPSDIMGMYTPDLLPVLSGLAKGFAVCDAWHSSVPTQTIPNRAFAAAATSQGHLDNHVKTFTCPSVFGRLSDKKIDWTIYGYNRAPLTRMDFPDTLRADPTHFGHFRDFQERAAKGTLAAYSFLEPSWSAAGNSQHPNYDVAAGEALILDTYRALRDGPKWNATLLIITYDEHGGNYDHVPPPSDAVAPGDGSLTESGIDFDFTRFGVRVPAVLISPLIEAGTVYRGTGRIDHTSILKTICERWKTEPLTKRDKAAASLGDVLTLSVPRKDDPMKGVLPPQLTAQHPSAPNPSKVDLLHAAKVAALPIRNEQGYAEETEPDLSTSASIGNFVRDRMAAWDSHLTRRRARHNRAGRVS
ncbi:MAG TPA: alkaline phosphatase family protein [Terriglobales bacterium]|nr:alkaline phosphatase family protein [Terriglobales bacterium]